MHRSAPDVARSRAGQLGALRPRVLAVARAGARPAPASDLAVLDRPELVRARRQGVRGRRPASRCSRRARRPARRSRSCAPRPPIRRPSSGGRHRRPVPAGGRGRPARRLPAGLPRRPARRAARQSAMQQRPSAASSPARSASAGTNKRCRRAPARAHALYDQPEPPTGAIERRIPAPAAPSPRSSLSSYDHGETQPSSTSSSARRTRPVHAQRTSRAPPSAAMTTAIAPVRQKRIGGVMRCLFCMASSGSSDAAPGLGPHRCAQCAQPARRVRDRE